MVLACLYLNSLAQVFRYVADEFGDEAGLTYVDKVFENQDWYYGNNTATVTQLKKGFADDAAEFLKDYNVTSAGVLAALYNSKYNMETRASWKLAAASGISACPTFLINQVVINEASDFDAY